MPFEQEKSSLSASGNFTKEMLDNNKSKELIYNNTLTNQIIEALLYLKDKKDNSIASVAAKKQRVYKKLYCIDGSLLTIPKEHGELVGLRVGAAIINTNDLFNIEKDNFGVPNPFQVAQIYNNKGNIFINSLLPSKNIYHSNGSHFYSLQESFAMALNDTFNSGIAKEIKEYFSYELLMVKEKAIKEISDWNCFENIIQNIREESIIFSTKKETQQIMLITESILSQYIISKSLDNKENSLIVIDGRLQNEDIGNILKKLNTKKIIHENNMLVGVQKSGILNMLLSKVHEVIKGDALVNTNLNNLKNIYNNGQSILLRLDNQFKEKCGIKTAGKGSYGTDYFYITQEPNRKEFVFTLPDHIFPDKSSPTSTNNKIDLDMLFDSLCGVFEYANTDLYILSKGALLTNIIAHDNVSLNKKYTSVLNQTNKEENTNNLSTNSTSKPKI